MGNDATATFDLNGNNTTVGGLTGGGTTGGKVSLGTGNLTVVSPSNATYAGSFTGAGGVTFNLGTLGSAATTQTLTGSGPIGGNLTLANGTLLLSPTSATTWGSATTNTAIAPGNGSNSVLTVGANTNLVSQYIMVGGDPATDAFNNQNGFIAPVTTGISTGGTATLNINSASSSHVTAQTLYIGTMARLATATTTTVNIGSAAPTPARPSSSPGPYSLHMVYLEPPGPAGIKMAGRSRLRWPPIKMTTAS